MERKKCVEKEKKRKKKKKGERRSTYQRLWKSNFKIYI
jgi:hypothetical protein